MVVITIIGILILSLGRKYLKLMNNIGIRFVEIGFRTLDTNSSKGIFAASTNVKF